MQQESSKTMQSVRAAAQDILQERQQVFEAGQAFQQIVEQLSIMKNEIQLVAEMAQKMQQHSNEMVKSTDPKVTSLIQTYEYTQAIAASIQQFKIQWMVLPRVHK